MKYHKIEGNIEGVPFILIPKSDLGNWHGFYLLDNESRYPDLKFGDQGFKIFDGDDFNNPKTDWGFVVGKILNANFSPIKVNLHGIEVIAVDPSYYTAWEGYDFWISEDPQNLYLILNIRKDFIDPENFNPDCLLKMRKVNTLQISLKAVNYRILASTEHGMDKYNTIFADIKLKPALYYIDLFIENKEFPGVAVYKFGVNDKQIKV